MNAEEKLARQRFSVVVLSRTNRVEVQAAAEEVDGDLGSFRLFRG